MQFFTDKELEEMWTRSPEVVLNLLKFFVQYGNQTDASVQEGTEQLRVFIKSKHAQDPEGLDAIVNNLTNHGRT